MNNNHLTNAAETIGIKNISRCAIANIRAGCINASLCAKIIVISTLVDI